LLAKNPGRGTLTQRSIEYRQPAATLKSYRPIATIEAVGARSCYRHLPNVWKMHANANGTRSGRQMRKTENSYFVKRRIGRNWPGSGSWKLQPRRELRPLKGRFARQVRGVASRWCASQRLSARHSTTSRKWLATCTRDRNAIQTLTRLEPSFSRGS